MPRYLFNGCCANVEHCVRVDTSEYVHALLHDTLALRGICKNALLKMNSDCFWVPDLVGKLLPACIGILEIAIGYKEISAADGVHFYSNGLRKNYRCHSYLLKQSTREKRCFVCSLSFSSSESGKTVFILLERIPLPSGQWKAQETANCLSAKPSIWRRKMEGSPGQCWEGQGPNPLPPLLQEKLNIGIV